MRPMRAPALVALAAACMARGGRAEAPSAQKWPPYNESEARTYVQYARASFCTSASLESWSCGDACEDAPVVPGSVRFIENALRGVQGFVAQMPGPGDRCIVSFRGSLKLQNWVEDSFALILKWPEGGADWCPGCYVYGGFKLAYEGLRSQLHEAVKDLKCQSVDVAGHSLGAALATLATLDLRAGMKLRVEKVYTFGSPRVGDAAFARAYVDAAGRQGVAPPEWRVVHYHDPVPRVPLANPFRHVPVIGGGYVHVPHEIYYTDVASSSFVECEPTGAGESGLANFDFEDKSCAWSAGIESCINGQHLSYLNKTFAFKDFSPKCRGEGLVAQSSAGVVLV